MKKALFLAAVFSLSTFLSVAQQDYLTPVETITTGYTSSVYTLNDPVLSDKLLSAPALEEHARSQGVEFELLDQHGNVIELEAFYSPIVAEDLAERYPEIRTYKVRGKGVTGRVGYTYKGFHGILFTTQGTLYIDPINAEESVYHTYHRKDFMDHYRGEKQHRCLVDEYSTTPEMLEIAESYQGRQTGVKLRTYRLALACTGEYAQFHGGTVTSVLSAMVVTMNRVNGVYERDFSVTMEIIGNNDDIIFFNASTDPYTNNSGFTMLGENQNTIDNIIGSANYDIGHVFSTGGGGIASLGSVCSFSNKARGVTGGGSPIGDPFDIDYVAHEMGHQFSGNHTQNNSCNRNPTTAWEPGSASTIMGYAGICSPNLQNNSDDYFHSGNYTEMRAFFQNGSGNTCASITNTGNTAPEVTVDPTNYVIPIETPFVLRGSATDNEGDDLTYCWEQMDLGPSTSPSNPTGNAPMFRSWDPVDHGERTFPRLVSVLSGSLVTGEVYPTYSRGMTFRLTVRDNNIAGGGVAYDGVNVGVDDTKGPFVVTSPPQNAQVEAGVYYTIEWDVAGTDQSPVNCNEVHILLYSNNGIDFEDTLVANVPNTGSYTGIMPTITGAGMRVRVEAADNVFFNYNPGAFNFVDPVVPSGDSIVLSVAPDWQNGGIDLFWNDPFTNENNWVIERSVGGNGNFVVIDTVDVNDTTYKDQQVSMLGTEYYYRVYAINPAGASAYSNEDSWLGVGVKELSSQHVTVFPNPSSSLVEVKTLGVRIESARLMDSQGRTVINFGQNVDQFSVQHLPAGSYFLHVQTAEKGLLVTPLNVVH